MLQRFFELVNRDKNEGDTKLKTRKVVQVGEHSVKIERKIAQGGYGDIYQVTL